MNEIRQQILDMLSDTREIVSGDRLATSLGLSRTAIWKHIRQIRQQGIDIASIPGRGYRLESDILNAAAIRRQLQQKVANPHIGRHIRIVGETDSTNAELLRKSWQEDGDGLVLLAERQMRGRGRLGRHWYSEPGQALTFSLLLRPAVPPESVVSLPLVAACALHQALHPRLPALRLKWPNDLLCHGAKLGGILTEIRAEPGVVQAVVIGIGLNIRKPAQGWPEDLRQPAVSLQEMLPDAIVRNEIAADCLVALDAAYRLWLGQGFAPFRDYWWRFHNACNRTVRVHNGQDYIEGTARGLDHDGALLLQTDSILQRIVAGDLEVMA